MVIPRITLWTEPLKLDARIALCPFNERYLDQQARNIQLTQQVIEITPGAIYILSNITGRRIPEPIRWVLFDSLQEIIEGGLRTQYPEKQDLLGSTFGEILGAALLALNLNGNIEIIRIIESSQGKSPDFIILQTTSSGKVVHLLECKGTVKDINNINQRNSIDLCQDIRTFREKGKEQLDNINFQQIEMGSRVLVREQKVSFNLPVEISKKYLSVVCIPDGRIIKLTSSTVAQANRPACRQTTCIECIKSQSTQDKSSLLAVIHYESIDSNNSTAEILQNFIDSYRSSEKSLWAGDNELFSVQIKELVNRISGQNLQVSLITIKFILLALIEEGISKGIKPSEIEYEIDKLVESFSGELLLTYANQLKDKISKQQSEKNIQNIAADDINQQEIFNQDYRNTKRLITHNTSLGSTNLSIRVIIELFNEAAIIRLYLILQEHQLLGSEIENLKKYVEFLINLIRNSSSKLYLHWREESFSISQENSDETRKFVIGFSWDQYPYPNPANGLPGFTAWVSYDGRAEIVVRQYKR